MSIDQQPFGVSQKELDAALAVERRRGMRKRLLAIRAVVAGRSIRDAAADVKTHPKHMKTWLQRLRLGGLRSLLRDERRRPPKWRMSAGQVEKTRQEIAAALERPLGPAVTSRLIAVDIVLSGQPVEYATAAARVLRGTVHAWLRRVARGGFAPALARWERRNQVRPRA